MCWCGHGRGGWRIGCAYIIWSCACVFDPRCPFLRPRHAPASSPRDAPSHIDMPPTPLRIAQTSNEVKKHFKQNGPRMSEQQQKQLERGHQLDSRAARLRDAEERRKAAKKKREEKEAKEAAARKQTGVGLATQLIGYSHTQAQMKKGMEAFVVELKKRKEDEQRRKEAELSKKLEAIVQVADKEPWDDDDEGDELALDLPQINISCGEQYADDDLDDDTLLEAHDLVMSDPIEAPDFEPQPPPAPAPSTAQPPYPTNDTDYIRLHGPINKAVESILDKLPEPLVELLSQDISMKLPDWKPAPGLLHKLNPLGLPPHRLRIKVGSVVSVLRDLNTSSQLSKSQHLRVLRVESNRLECLVLNGQLERTTTFLTRIPFQAKYRNDDAYPFQRIQFPIRIAADYVPPCAPRVTTQTGFKLPALPVQPKASSLLKRSFATPTARSASNQRLNSKTPGLPAFKSAPPFLVSLPSAPSKAVMLDGWDDFLESGTQIARELSSETASPSRLPPPAKASPSIAQSLPPLSTQDLDFSMDDLEDVSVPVLHKSSLTNTSATLTRPKPSLPPAKLPHAPQQPTPKQPLSTMHQPNQPRQMVKDKSSRVSTPSTLPPKKTRLTAAPLDLSAITPSQMPRSVPDHHPKMFKRKANTPPTVRAQPPAKKAFVHTARSAAMPKTLAKKDSFDDFALSTQDAASFFDDEDLDWMFYGSPPITV